MSWLLERNPFSKRAKAEASVVEATPAPPEIPPFLEAFGVCPVCLAETTFRADGPWLRESFVCQACGCLPRERALAAVLEKVRPNWRQQRIHESSPSSRGSLRLRSECEGYLASQYDPSTPFGQMSEDGAYRSEDLEAQTFDDERFDIVVTQDVFEHLFRPDLAIAEIARTLSPGGVHVCTVPLVRTSAPSTRRAVRTEDGLVTHLQPPEHHGNPMNEEGSLVTVDWGFDIADYFQRHGGLSTTIFDIDDLTQGIRAKLNEVIVARKAGVPDV